MASFMNAIIYIIYICTKVGAVRVSRQLLQRRHGRTEVRLHAGGLPPAPRRHHLLLRLPKPLV